MVSSCRLDMIHRDRDAQSRWKKAILPETVPVAVYKLTLTPETVIHRE